MPVPLLLGLLAICIFMLSGCSVTGACVGTGGVLLFTECKEDWDQSECDSWNDQGINGATWTFHKGQSCPDLGYTEMCSDGSYREPGNC